MSEVLRKAREYEEKHRKEPPAEIRPKFHFTAPVGWLNDPNGFSWYQDRYHLFYQYHPYGTKWGSVHWGHAVSSDLIQWEHVPAAMAPGDDYDRDGCFSGSAITMKDGSHLLMYTGFVYDESDPKHRGIQTQNIAIGDGSNYRKCTSNPVLSVDDIPGGGDPYDFRDPKVWMDHDGILNAVIASGEEMSGARIIVFRSNDGVHWKYSHVLLENRYRFGRMWECPDYFPLDDAEVILVNAMDMEETSPEFHSGNNGLYFLGRTDPDSKRFLESSVHTLDHGMDFYAGQTMLAPDGRRILIGWMQNPGTASEHETVHSYFGQMSIPRELHIEKGRLLQMPIRELESYRTCAVEHRNVTLCSEKKKLDGVSGRILDMELIIRCRDSKRPFNHFEMRFAQHGDRFAALTFSPVSRSLRVSRPFSPETSMKLNERETVLPKWDGMLQIRMILDEGSAELFLNGGETVFSMTLETDPKADNITFVSDGDLILDVKTYKLDSTLR